MKPTDEARTEARSKPAGWVYAIDGQVINDPNSAVPNYAIKGGWAVDSNGEITGDFIPNPNYRPRGSPP
jgi:hypothetical protein